MSTEKETKTKVEAVVNAGKEAVETVKDSAEKVVDAAKEVVDTTKEVVGAAKEVASSKKTTWWNRIWSAIVGIALAVGSMFGITTAQINEQKAKTEEIKTVITAAIEDIKAGKITDATTKLETAVATGKEVVSEAKKVIDNVKNTDKEKTTNVVKEAAAKELVKDVKNTTTKEAAKPVETKK